MLKAWLRQSVKTDHGLVPVRTEFLSKGVPIGAQEKLKAPLDPSLLGKVERASQELSV